MLELGTHLCPECARELIVQRMPKNINERNEKEKKTWPFYLTLIKMGCRRRGGLVAARCGWLASARAHTHTHTHQPRRCRETTRKSLNRLHMFLLAALATIKKTIARLPRDVIVIRARLVTNHPKWNALAHLCRMRARSLASDIAYICWFVFVCFCCYCCVLLSS